MNKVWRDPTLMVNDSCSVCYMWNHEWQKHGSCFAGADPLLYFNTALSLWYKIANISVIVNSYHGQTVSLDSILKLFPKKANIVCDPQDAQNSPNLGIFSEIQTCWTSDSNQNYGMIDCPPVFVSNWTITCPSMVLIR